MKIKVSRSVLTDGLKKVSSIVPGKPAMQILANVKVEATEDGTLVLSASDLDMTIQTAVKCEVEEAGITTLPAKLLLSAVQKLPDGTIEIEVDAEVDKATLKGGSAVYRMSGLPAKDFPTAEKVEVIASYTLSQPALRDMLRKTVFACSDDGTRRALTGISVGLGDGKITIVATDGRRLALVESEAVEDKSTDGVSIIITRSLANELQRLLETEGDAKVSVADGKIAFAIGQTVITSKLVDEKFPNYRAVIPDIEKNGYRQVSIDRAAFIAAIDRASVVATGDSDSVRITLSPNELIISSQSCDDLGSARDVVPIKYDGEKVEVLFKPQYVLDPLKAIDDDEVSFWVVDGQHPAVMKCGCPFIGVIMPLRTAQ